MNSSQAKLKRWVVMLQKLGLFTWVDWCFLDKILDIKRTSFKAKVDGWDGQIDRQILMVMPRNCSFSLIVISEASGLVLAHSSTALPHNSDISLRVLVNYCKKYYEKQ